MPIDGATIRLLRVKFLEYGPAVKPSRSCPGGKPAMRAAVKIVVSHGRDSSQGWFRKAVRAAFPDAKISHHGSTTELVIRMAAPDFAMAKSNTAKCHAELLAKFEVAALKPPVKQRMERRFFLPHMYKQHRAA